MGVVARNSQEIILKLNTFNSLSLNVLLYFQSRTKYSVTVTSEFNFVFYGKTQQKMTIVKLKKLIFDELNSCTDDENPPVGSQ